NVIDIWPKKSKSNSYPDIEGPKDVGERIKDKLMKQKSDMKQKSYMKQKSHMKLRSHMKLKSDIKLKPHIKMKSHMIEGDPWVYGVGFVAIKLLGNWMAEMVDTWAPEHGLEFKITIVNSPSWDESNLMPMDALRRQLIIMSQMHMLEYVKSVAKTFSGNEMSLPSDELDKHFRTVEKDGEMLIYVKDEGNTKPIIRGKNNEMKPTMKEFASNDQANYYSRITSIKVNRKNAYELKGNFLNDLHNHAFSETNREDAVEHIKYFLRFVDPLDLPNVDPDLFTYDIERTKNYDDYINEFNDEFEETWDEYGVPYEIGDHICYMTYFQDDEWYNDLMEESLKDKALEQKAIYEESWGEAKQSRKKDVKCLIIISGNIRIFEMVKYSFRDDEEYVTIKENEHDDLTNISEDACRAYQEIFRKLDEGWMVIRME
nr:hypothetical protein [Tanacetum cinerariifolium]